MLGLSELKGIFIDAKIRMYWKLTVKIYEIGMSLFNASMEVAYS